MLDTIDFPAVFLGAIRAGVVPVPLNTLLTCDQYAYVLADCRARVLFISQALLPVVKDMLNFGAYPMSHALTRLQSRFQAQPSDLEHARERIGEALDAEQAEALGLVTFALDDIDWDDEIRVFFEERTSFSPDSLTGMEANLRFVGPETMETKIFGRLTAWQNWIFQRPNAVGEKGALKAYGQEGRAEFDWKRT